MLTWIINLIKWNAGHTKYKFVYPPENESPQKILNNALVPDHHQPDELQKHNDDKKNKFALKMNSENDPKVSRAKKSSPQPSSHKSGQFLASKQMIFGMDSKKLEPTEYSTS